MRTVLEFLSLLAVGLFVAVAAAVYASDSLPFNPGRGGPGLPQLDYGALCLGIVIGMVLSHLTRIRWGELPQRMKGYVAAKRGSVLLVGWAGVCAAVLLFY